MQQKQQQPLTVFCIAAPEDASLLSRWKEYLLPLQEDGYLTIWPERHLADEGTRPGECLTYLLQADLLFLLVSPLFFASDKHLAHMERALQRHASGEASVFFLLLQSVTRQEETLMSLPYLPPNGLAVNEWNDTDAAFRSCLQEVIQFLELPSDDPSFELPQKRAWMLERLSQIYNDSLRSSWQHMAWSKLGLSENSAAILNVSQRLLRLWLWQSKQFPWKIRTFLKDSLNCILQCSGGGYSFIHRHLFDYLARLDTLEEPSTATYIHSTGTSGVP